jgi:hypothetical protein
LAVRDDGLARLHAGLLHLGTERGFVQEATLGIDEVDPFQVAGRGDPSASPRAEVRPDVLGLGPGVDDLRLPGLDVFQDVLARCVSLGVESDRIVSVGSFSFPSSSSRPASNAD